MKWKRLLLISILVVAMALFGIPAVLEAIDNGNNMEELCYTAIEPIGETQGALDCWEISSPCGQPILEVGAARELPSGRWESWLTTSDGNFGGTRGAWNVTGIGTSTVLICENVDNRVPDVFVAFYECMECPKVSEPEPIARTHDMTCYQVWINEDNCFEFVFWWEYYNNNHVQIYDMDGNLVWETDFAKGESQFEACLPDGMYTVKTFHEAGHILQEFIIGKP